MSERARGLLLSLLLIASSVGLSTAAQAGALQWGDCPTLPDDAASAARMQCGWLDTDTRIDGAAVRLRVVILRARPDRQSAHPVIYIPGGPGDPAGLTASDLVTWQRFQQRAGWPTDLVLFDPRGTGASQPRPLCSSEQSSSDNISLPTASCYQTLGARTADALGPTAQVHDIVALIHALKVNSATLWAVSYGARIARGVVADAPQSVRSLVLDSPVSTLRSAAADQSAAERQVVAALIADCRARLACRLAVPSARAALEGLLAASARRAPRLVWAHIPRRPWSSRLTPSRLLSMILLTSYRPTTYADTVARLQLAARTGDVAWLAPLAATLGAVVDNHGHSRAVYSATRCAYQRSRHDSQPASAHPLWLNRYLASTPAEECRGWPVTAVEPASGAARVPILSINGGRDNVTPADRAAPAMGLGQRRVSVIIPGAGHAPTLSNGCAQRLVAHFLVTSRRASVLDGNWVPRCGIVMRQVPWRG